MRRTFATLAIALGAIASSPIANAQPEEDEPGWSCVDDGNRVCGPNNGQAPAGCYDDGGVMVAAWPCSVTIDPQTGDTDVWTPEQRRNPVDVY